MGLLDALKSGARASLPPLFGGGKKKVVDDDLFDDEFQRKLEHLALVSRKVFAGRMRAERRTKKSGSGVEFADHRDYQPGDDFRTLDWNVYQRFDRLLVRLYEEEEDLAIYVILDASGSMGFDERKKLRYGKVVAAALAYVGLANLDRVAIVSTSDIVAGRMPETRGKSRIFKVFRFLTSVEPKGLTDLESAMKTFVAQNKRRGLAVLISDLYDPEGFEKGINVLRYAKFEPLVIHVVDENDGRPKLQGDLLLYDCETGDEREVTVTAKVLDRFEEEYVYYLRKIERFCSGKQVGYVKADIRMPFDDLVLRIFRRGGFLR